MVGKCVTWCLTLLYSPPPAPATCSVQITCTLLTGLTATNLRSGVPDPIFPPYRSPSARTRSLKSYR